MRAKPGARVFRQADALVLAAERLGKIGAQLAPKNLKAVREIPSSLLYEPTLRVCEPALVA